MTVAPYPTYVAALERANADLERRLAAALAVLHEQRAQMEGRRVWWLAWPVFSWATWRCWWLGRYIHGSADPRSCSLRSWRLGPVERRKVRLAR